MEDDAASSVSKKGIKDETAQQWIPEVSEIHDATDSYKSLDEGDVATGTEDQQMLSDAKEKFIESM
jgi:hypothetical protein